MKKFAITYKDEGVENPSFIFTEQEAAKKWIDDIQHGVGALELCIKDKNENHYEAGCDGGYFLNSLP